MTGTTRYHCPLDSCPWTHDDPGPGTDADAKLPAVELSAKPGTLDDAMHEATYRALLAHALGQDNIIRQHLETHSLEEWVREIMRLRDQLAPLAALAPDGREAVGDDPQFFAAGRSYLSVNGWFLFTCQAVAAGVALGTEEQVKGFELHRPLVARQRVWKSVRVAGCYVDATGPLAARDRFVDAMDRLIHGPGVSASEVDRVKGDILRLGGAGDG